MFNYHFIDGWYWKHLARKIIIFTRLHIYTLHKPLAKKYNLRPNYQYGRNLKQEYLNFRKKHDDILEMQCAPVCVNILYKA